MVKITFLAVEECLSSSISNLMDAFLIANLCNKAMSENHSSLFETEVVALDGKPVVSSNYLLLNPQGPLDAAIDSDYLIIPAFLPVPDAGKMQDARILDYICRRHAAGTTIAAVCTGSFLLAETGLLNGRAATTNWQFEKKFRYRYPEANLQVDKILTEEDNLICTGAATAMMNLAMKIIRREGSDRLTLACAKALLVDPNRDSQAPYVVHQLAKQHIDKEISKAEQYMSDHFNTNISIDQVAEYVCISPRHFKRRFKSATGESPLNYLQKLRMQRAKERLETTRDTIDEITRLIGYEDGSTFRRLFKRYTSLTPREYRDKFLQLD